MPLKNTILRAVVPALFVLPFLGSVKQATAQPTRASAQMQMGLLIASPPADFKTFKQRAPTGDAGDYMMVLAHAHFAKVEARRPRGTSEQESIVNLWHKNRDQALCGVYYMALKASKINDADATPATVEADMKILTAGGDDFALLSNDGTDATVYTRNAQPMALRVYNKKLKPAAAGDITVVQGNTRAANMTRIKGALLRLKANDFNQASLTISGATPQPTPVKDGRSVKRATL